LENSGTAERINASGFYRVCWLPTALPIEMKALGKDEAVDRRVLEAALRLADLYFDRVTILTLDPKAPHRTLNPAGGSPDLSFSCR